MFHTINPASRVIHLCGLVVTLVSMIGAFTLPAQTDLKKQAPASQRGGSIPQATSPAPIKSDQARLRETYGRLPLRFEANDGQTNRQVKFLARGDGYNLFLTSQEAVLTLRGNQKMGAADADAANRENIQPAGQSQESRAVLRMKLAGANPVPLVQGCDKLPGRSHYFIGNDPRQWRTDIPHYGRIKYSGVYPGVDLIYYGHQGQLEYDFVVSPGSDPRTISLSFAGAQEVRLDAEGELVLAIGSAEIRQRKPIIYQEVAGARREIAGGYRIEGKDRVSFTVGTYDESRELVIDPVLVYSTYLGGSGFDAGFGITVDGSGHAYVTGHTDSPNFPTTAGAFQLSNAGGNDAVVTKLNRAGTGLVYSTYLGGSGFDTGRAIAVDCVGNAHVTGGTSSLNFPTTPGAIQSANGGGSGAFVTKLNRGGGNLVYSTYLGGTAFPSGVEAGSGIAVDGGGDTYVVGSTDSTDFPITPGAFQPAHAGGVDAFVTKLNRRGTALVYSTYLGGVSNENARDIAVDDDDSAYVTGNTSSPGFPTTPTAFQTANPGGPSSAFVTKLNRSGAALVYSTYLGGSASDVGRDIAVESSGEAYVVGDTDSLNFPTTPGAFQPAFAGGPDEDAFVTKLNRRGEALVYSTYLGGTGLEEGTGIGVDEKGFAYVSGSTTSLNFPLAPGAFQTANAGGDDAFVTKLNRNGTALVYSSYLGGSGGDTGDGIAVEASGEAYLIGITNSSNFPTTPGSYQTTDPDAGLGTDAFVAKIAN